MEEFRSLILARVAQGETLDEAARFYDFDPASVWKRLNEEVRFREGYRRALWTSCQAQLTKLEAEANALKGDPDISDILDNFDMSERAAELLIRTRVADHAGKRRHIAAMLAHWRWRCQHLAPNLFGDIPIDLLPDSETGLPAARYSVHGH